MNHFPIPLHTEYYRFPSPPLIAHAVGLGPLVPTQSLFSRTRNGLRLRLWACFTPGSLSILHSTPPATQRASLSRSCDLTVASFIKIIDSGHQDSQYLATLTFDATAGAAQDECPASPSPTVVGWMATRMAATPTTVARWMPVPIAVPLAAVGAREEVAPHCVTDLGDYACRQVLLPR